MTPIPSWDQFMVHVLRIQSDGEVRILRDLISAVADKVGLSSEQSAELLGSGQQVVANRIGWAASYLTRVGAMARPARGKYVLTAFGREFLNQHPETITEADLRSVAKEGDEWWINRTRQQRTGDQDAESAAEAGADGLLDPTEMISKGIELVHGNVKAELIERLTASEPAFFEQAVVKLLVAMGYGGTGGQAAATRLVNDGGIDGVIDQDILGLNKVFIQAKRYAPDNTVGRPEVQAFVGALSGKAEQGVFITSGRFSAGAREYSERDARVRIILIDGPHLVDLMVKFRVGVQVKHSVDLVEIDEDFFE